MRSTRVSYIALLEPLEQFGLVFKAHAISRILDLVIELMRKKFCMKGFISDWDRRALQPKG